MDLGLGEVEAIVFGVVVAGLAEDDGAAVEVVIAADGEGVGEGLRCDEREESVVGREIGLRAANSTGDAGAAHVAPALSVEEQELVVAGVRRERVVVLPAARHDA